MKRGTFIASGGAAAALAALPSIAHAAEDVTLTTPTGKLFGMLEVPASAKAGMPVVLIIAGSGPTDRDGNSPLLPGKNDSLKLLALGLAARGIASLRYDKRGAAASRAAAGSESDLRFNTYVDDALGWVRSLRADKRFTRLTIAGHSEGSLIGMIAAQRASADGYVSLEGAGRPAAVLLREQIDKPTTPRELAAQAGHIIDELAAGRTVADVPAALAPLFHASVQPYIISWFRYDPSHEIAKLKGRVAIVQGTADVQVVKADAEALHAALPTARYVLVEGMNHVLKHAPDTTTPAAVLAGYTDPSLPVEPAVIDTVAAVALQ